MSFAHPLALLLLLLLIPVGLLYWLRLRVPRVVVGTGLFWQKALAEEPLRARWQHWRTPVSLALHALTVVLLALAASGPEIPPPQRIVLILDNSATMRATDVQPSRFDAAKEAALRMIDNLRWCDEMAVVTTSPNPVEVQPMTSGKALLRAAVDSAQALPQAPAIQWAAKVADKVAGTDEGRLKPGLRAPRIVLVTDGCATEATRAGQRCGIEVLRVGTRAGNRAITCFTARRSNIDPAQCEVFVEVQSHGDQLVEGELELLIDGKSGPSVQFTIEKDGRWQHLSDRLTLPTAARLTARITPCDDYPFDDTAVLEVPAPGAPDTATDSVARPSVPHLFAQIPPDASEGGIAELYRSVLLARSHPKQRLIPMPPYAELLGPLYGEPNGVDIRVPSDIGLNAAAAQYELRRLPLWIPFAAAAAVLVILEWCFYLRRWTS
jgi:hypothetical protein